LILLDTNILLRYAGATDPALATVDTAITTLHSRGEVLCMVPQNVYEFRVTATRPIASNGLGLSIPECQVQVARLKRLLHFLPDLPTLFAEWESLVVAHACHGRVSYDARLVAAMRTHGLPEILTFNTADFARFPGLTVLDPTKFAAPAAPPISTP
jgi:predicted nucleic acid-binding protein